MEKPISPGKPTDKKSYVCLFIFDKKKAKRLKYILSSILVFLATGFLLLAQETPRTINFTKDQYQAYNQNWAVSQTPNHLMYFGNNAGLLEFDGSAWRTTPLPNRQIIRAVACDKKGNIFTGGFEEMGVWQRKNGCCLKYQSLTALLDNAPLEKEEIWHILVTDSLVYFQSFSNIYQYDYKTLKHITPPSAIMYLQWVNKRLLLPVIDRGIYEYTKTGFTFIKGSEILAGKRVMSILPYRNQQFLVGTASDGIFEYNANGTFTSWQSEVQNALRSNQLNKGALLSNGMYAFGTILNGLYIIHPGGKIMYHINQKNGLQNNTILGLYEDHAKNLWIGLDKGIDLVELSSPLTFFKDKNGAIGTVYAAAIHQNNLYIGSNQGIFVKPWHPLKYAYDESDFQLIKGTQGQVWELQVFDNQLVAGHNEGTFLIDRQRAERISERTGGWVTQRCPDQPDCLIQGTYTGLIVLKKSAAGHWQFSHRIAGFTDPVIKILFDNDHHLWVVNPYRGLYRMQLDTNFRQITDLYAFKKHDGLPSEFKLDIEKMDNQVVVKSNDHFFYYNAQKNRFEPYHRTDNPLLEPGAFRLKNGWQDDWFKIYRNKVQYWSANWHTEFNLTLAPDFESVILLTPQLYLFGLDDGYALLHLDAVRKEANPLYFPPVLIHKVEVSNRKKSYLLPISGKKPAQLSATENNLHFVFSQPVFDQTPAYSYLLEGYDTEWSNWQTLPEKEFTRLPPGHYTFKIKSQNSVHLTLFRFIIQSHWYQTWWAFMGYVIVLGLGIWLMERWNQHRLEIQRKILEEEKERQLEEERMKAVNERLQFDVINKSKELANSTMDLIQKNEILLKIKEELQALRTTPQANFSGRHYQKITHLIDTHISSDHDWQVFEMNFSQVHEPFFKKLKTAFPNLTPGDLKLAAYLKMNLSSKEIAPLLNISIRSVENKRYRLRKKLQLDEEVNLTEFMLGY